MRVCGVLIGSLLLAGCQAMQPSPVAPSATAPPQASTSAPAGRPAPSFGVSLSENGGIAFLNQPWSSTLVVTSSDTTPPASVSVQCGSQAPQLMAGFVGVRVVGCTFDTRGDYVVTAAVVAPNAVTTSATIALQAIPAPVVPPPAPIPPSLAIGSLTRIGGTATAQEWRLSASGSADLTDFCWSFGDGAGACGKRTEQHKYTGAAGETRTFTVKVAARHPTVGEVSSTRDLTITFADTP